MLTYNIMLRDGEILMLSNTSLGWDDDPRVLRLLRDCSLEVRFLQYSLITSF